MSEKIVITGWGCLTAVGNNVVETWEAVKSGQTGISQIGNWDTTQWEYPLGAEIKNYNPRTLIADKKLLKLLSKHDVIGLNSVEQAVHHSQLISYRDSLTDPTEFNERTGMYVASPGTKFNQQYDYFPLLTQSDYNLKKFGTELNSVVHPMWLLRTLPNNVLAYTGIQFGFKGANQNIINHSVGGCQAIIEAFHAMKCGMIDRAVVVGYDSMIEPQAQSYYSALGVVSKNGLKPFDGSRDGTILGEGSGTLILETFTSAKQRNAQIYGEIICGASTNEAMGIFALREDGSGLTQVIQDVIEKAQLSVDQIGMITAHGNGTQLSDSVEANSIKNIFHKNTPVTGFKWSLGHTFAAAGIIETILTLIALKEQISPGIATLENISKDCSEIRVSPQSQKLSTNTGLVLNRGFASVSSCIAVSVN